jgi:hypothetical protein
MIVDIAHTMLDYFPGDTVVLIHDHGSWDAQALLAYNLMIDEAGRSPERIWGSLALFEGSLAKTGEECTGLQVADMIAYETFKGIKAKTNAPETAIRGAVREMINKQIPIAFAMDQSSWNARVALGDEVVGKNIPTCIRRE